MNGLQALQTLFGPQLGEKADLKSLKDGESRAFLDTLLDSDVLRGSGLDIEALKAWLDSDGGKDLPLEAFFAASAEDVALPEAGLGDAAPQSSGAIKQSIAELAASANFELSDDELPDDELLARMLMHGGLEQAPLERDQRDFLSLDRQPGSEQAAQQLASRLALLEQAQMRRQFGEQAQALRGTAAEGEVAPPSPLQSYAQTSQLLDQGARALMPTVAVNVPMDQSGWGQALGERLMLLANQGTQQARIQLNPRELGPLEVNITVKDDKATINFTAQHAVTREALEAELPRLRMMMQENGFEELDVQVGREEGRSLADGEQGDDDEQNQAGGSDEQQLEGTEQATAQPRGLVDHYA